MKINPVVYGVLVVVVFVGIIGGFQLAGVWTTSGKVTGSGQQVQPSAADVDTIKGWMTLEQVSAAFGVPVAEILSAFELSGDIPASTALKDLESEAFDIPGLRTWLQERHQANP